MVKIYQQQANYLRDYASLLSFARARWSKVISWSSNNEDERSCEESHSAHDRPWRVNSSVFAILSMGGCASIGTSWTSAMSSRFSQSLKSCVRRPLRRSAFHNFVLRFRESLDRKRTRLSGRSAASRGKDSGGATVEVDGSLNRCSTAQQFGRFVTLELKTGEHCQRPTAGSAFAVLMSSPACVVLPLDNWRRRKERTSPTVSFAVTGGCSTRWWMSWRGELSCSLATWPFPTAATLVAALRTWWMRKS